MKATSESQKQMRANEEMESEKEEDEVGEERETVEGKWSEEQNLKYTVFMDFHKNIFISKQKRKSIKIFKLLSNFIKTRTPRQCRSHFQKLIHKHQTISKLKTKIRNSAGKDIYDKLLQQYTVTVDLNEFQINNDLFYDKTSSSTVRHVSIQTDIVSSMFIEPQNQMMDVNEKKSSFAGGIYPVWFYHPGTVLPF